MTTFHDSINDLTELTKEDHIDRTLGVELLRALQDSDLTVIDCDLDFWTDGEGVYNSYNNAAPVVFEIRKLTNHIVGIAFHRAGDVRGNYTDPVFIAGTTDELINIISELSIDRYINGWHISQSYIDEAGCINAWNEITNEAYNGWYERGPESLRIAYESSDLA